MRVATKISTATPNGDRTTCDPAERNTMDSRIPQPTKSNKMIFIPSNIGPNEPVGKLELIRAQLGC